jgi:tetratricopeptide (TPR) repeat protein
VTQRDTRDDEERRRLAARRQSTLDELERDLSALQTKPPWAALGVEQNAGAAELRAAYLALSKRYHPHVYAHLDSPEITRAATELFIAHKRAYTLLASQCAAAPEPDCVPAQLEVKMPCAIKVSGVSLRADARKSVRPVDERAPQRTLSKPPATRHSPRPPAAPDSGPPAAGAPRTKSVVTSPAVPTHKRRVVDGERALKAGLKHLAGSRFDEAVAEMERAVELCPERRDAAVWLHVCRARRHKASGRDAQAREEYRALLELDPEHREALEHAGSRALRRRAGLISKWFGDESE